MPPLTVRWSLRSRLLAALFTVLSLALAAWSFTTPGAVIASVLAAAGLLFWPLALAHTLLFRVESDDTGLDIRELRGARHIPWNALLRVELIAQWRDTGYTIRAATTDPAEAYHIVLVTRTGRINLNRHMEGIDALLDDLHRRGELQIGHEIMRDAALRAERPAMRALDTLAHGASFFKAGFGALFVTLLVSLMAAVSPRFALTGSLLVDLIATAAILLGLFAAVIHLARSLRLQRFGLTPKDPPPSTVDLLFTYTAAIGGPLLVVGFLPRLIAGSEQGRPIDGILLLVGVWFTTMPVKEFIAYAFKR
jgi:hypothetical protein